MSNSLVVSGRKFQSKGLSPAKKVWIAHPIDGYVEGHLIKEDSPNKWIVRLQDGKVINMIQMKSFSSENNDVAF